MNKTVAALYQFKKFEVSESIRQSINDVCVKHDVLGTLLLATEGINGTISGTKKGVEAVVDFVVSIGFDELELKYSYADEDPFLRLKIVLKQEIVTLGESVDPCDVVGEYIKVADWNALISQPDILLIDTRNNYEYELGTFKGAVNPNTECFREFPRYVASIDKKKYRKVAMFCTGGIRCEKASSYMLSQGFEAVYHLHGGVLKYLEEMPIEDSLWEGDCFVFDRRVALSHGLKITGHKQCYACRRALTQTDLMHEDYQIGVSCHHCIHITSKERQAAFAMRQKQVEQAVRENRRFIGETR